MGIKEIMPAVLEVVDSNNERLLILEEGVIIRSTSTVNSPAEEAVFNQQVLNLHISTL